MEILFYRYNSICEPDVITAFRKLGRTVIEEKTQMTEKGTTASQTVDKVSKLVMEHSFIFVFSINFFPALSEVCEISKLPYVCWTVDAPVLELFSDSLKNKCNRVFMFDRAQYLYFKDRNPEGIFHLPLATNPDRWDKVINETAPSLVNSFASDISFVGSLYNEERLYVNMKNISEYSNGYIQGLIETQLQVYGVNFIENMITDKLINELNPSVLDMYQPLCEGNIQAQRYLIAHNIVGLKIAEIERLRLLNLMAEYYDVDLYTMSDASLLPKVRIHSGVNTLREMPLVFYGSRINMNFTIRPIVTGLSLRVFDVCGCGGFHLTNWQEELPELYEPGVDVECFCTQEELLDKVGFYLEHEDERRAIARNGYERTKAEHSYDKRIAEMIKIVYGTI